MGTWTPELVDEFYDVVKTWSVQAARDFMAANGLEGLPKVVPKDWDPLSVDYEGGFWPPRLSGACIEACDASAFEALKELGILTTYEPLYSGGGWNSLWESIQNEGLDAEKQQRLESFIDVIAREGPPTLFCGLSFSGQMVCDTGLAWILYVGLPEEDGLRLLKTIQGVGVDVFVYVVNDSVLVHDRRRLLAFVAENGHAEEFARRCGMSPTWGIVPKGLSIETLDYAESLGFKFTYVDPRGESREYLLDAAHYGMKPAFKKGVTNETAQDAERQGMREVLTTNDLELIGAFLDAGATEEVSVAEARANGRDDLAELFLAKGFPEVPEMVVHAAPYIDPVTKEANIPEGVTALADDAFYRGYSPADGTTNEWVSAIHLPSTLRSLGDRALVVEWCGERPARVTIPKGVTELGLSVCYGFDEVTVYDGTAINPPHERPYKSIFISIKGGGSGFEVIVRSAATGELKFKVWMPSNSSRNWVYRTYSSAWGPNATFDFKTTDALFDKLPKQDKIRTAIDRLRWPVDLDDDHKAKLTSYCKRLAKDVIKALVDLGDAEGVEFFYALGLITKKNVQGLVDYAALVKAGSNIAELLEGYKSIVNESPKARPKKARPSKKTSSAKKAEPTASHESKTDRPEGEDAQGAGSHTPTEGLVFSEDGTTVTGCKSPDAHVVIPEGVTHIDAAAFFGMAVAQVELPSTLKSIGRCAFDCTALECVTIPKGVEYIGPSAFGRMAHKPLPLPEEDYWETSDCPVRFEVEEGNSVYESWNGSLVEVTSQPGPDGQPAKGYRLLSMYYEYPPAPERIEIPEGITSLATGSIIAGSFHSFDLLLPDSLVKIEKSAVADARVSGVHIGPNLVDVAHDFWRYVGEDLPFIYSDFFDKTRLKEHRDPTPLTDIEVWNHNADIDSRNPRYSIKNNVLHIGPMPRKTNANTTIIPSDFPAALVANVAGLDDLSEFEKRTVEGLHPGDEIGLSAETDAKAATGRAKAPLVTISIGKLKDMGHLGAIQRVEEGEGVSEGKADKPEAYHTSAAGHTRNSGSNALMRQIAENVDAVVAQVKSVASRAEAPDGRLALVVDIRPREALPQASPAGKPTYMDETSRDGD